MSIYPCEQIYIMGIVKETHVYYIGSQRYTYTCILNSTHLSAKYTMMVFTLGMSIPFSITVVATNTSAYTYRYIHAGQNYDNYSTINYTHKKDIY